MSTPVFLPGVDWLFIHGDDPADTLPAGIGTIRIDRANGGEAIVDDEGRWHTVPASSQVRGYATLTGQQEIEWADSRNVRADAVVALPRTVAVDETDEVTLAGIDRFLDGTYRITAVRATPVHVRCLMERLTDDPVRA